MFLNQKKGNLTAEEIIKILIAVVLIFVILALTYSIWNAIFPSPDKSSIKSFDTVYTLLKAKSESTRSYDSSTMNVYFKSDYFIVFFDNGVLDCSKKYPNSLLGSMSKIVNAPKACGGKSQCMCLYNQQLIDKDVVKCYPLDKSININLDYFDMNNNICIAVSDTTKIYNNYIFAKYYNTTAQKDYVFILIDNDANRALDKEWSIPRCVKDHSGLCKDEKDQTIITFGTDDKINNMFDYCQKKDPKYKTNIIRCVYDEATDFCDADCSYGDISSKCGTTYKSCSDINEDNGIIKYIDTEYDYRNKVLCDNSKKYCDNLNACQISSRDIYACKDDSSIDGSVNINGAKCRAPPSDLKNSDDTKADCKIVYSNELSGNKIGLFIESYDDGVEACQNYMDDKFYTPVSIMACRKDMLYDCEKFVEDKDNVKNCELKYINKGDYYWLTHYNTAPSGCSDIDKYFISAQFCDEVPAPVTP